MANVVPDAALEADVAVIAQKGAGKTYALKGLVERLLDAGRRVVILDPLNSWWGLKVRADGSPGYPIPVIGGANADVPLDPLQGEKLGAVIAAGAFSAVIDVSDLRRDDMIGFAIDFLAELYRVNRDPIWLVLEEADVFAPQNPEAKGTRRMHDVVDQIARRGRARGFRLWTITQRPARLSKDVLTQASTLLLLRLRSPQDRAAAQEWIKGHAEPGQAAEISGSLASLGVGEGYVWSPDLDLLARVHFPAIRTLDTSATPKAGDAKRGPLELATPDLTALIEAMSISAPSKEAEKIDMAPSEAILERERQAARHAGWEQGFSEGRTQGHSEGVKAGHEEGRRVGISQALGDLRPVIARLEELAYADVSEAVVSDAEAMRLQGGKVVALAPRPPRRIVKAEAVKPVFESPQSVADIAAAAEISGPQARILSALRWAEVYLQKESIDRTVLGFLAEVSHKGSGFQNNLGALRTLGLIDYPASGFVQLTGIGRSKVGDQPPISFEDLRATVSARLPGGERRIFALLCDQYPLIVSRENIASELGLSVKASGFQNSLGRLRTLGLIRYPAQGVAQAEAYLFGAHER